MDKLEWTLNAKRLAATLDDRYLNHAELKTLGMLLETVGTWMATDRVLARRALNAAIEQVNVASSPERRAQLSETFARARGGGMIKAATPGAR
jgi:hypothetical protein